MTSRKYGGFGEEFILKLGKMQESNERNRGMKQVKEILGRMVKDIKEYGWAIVSFGVYYVLIHVLSDVFCPLLWVTGIPCAGCGMTRAFLYLLGGQFQRAMHMNPSVLLVICFSVYFCVFRYGLGKKVKGLKISLIILVAGMLIIYGYRMRMYFPNEIPYVYYADNLLAKRLPGYENLINKIVTCF